MFNTLAVIYKESVQSVLGIEGFHYISSFQRVGGYTGRPIYVYIYRLVPL